VARALLEYHVPGIGIVCCDSCVSPENVFDLKMQSNLESKMVPNAMNRAGPDRENEKRFFGFLW